MELAQILKFADREIEEQYGKKVRDFVAKNIPESHRDLPWYVFVGSRELTPAQKSAVEKYIGDRVGGKHCLVLTGINGDTNKIATKMFQGSQRPLLVTVAPDLRGLDLMMPLTKDSEESKERTEAANRLIIALGAIRPENQITVFSAGTSGALGMLTTARLVFHKQPNKIDLTQIT